MTSGNQSGSNNRCLILIVLAVFFLYSCESGRTEEINSGVYFLKENQAIINNIFKPFSKTNIKGDIVVIYFDKVIPTVIPSSSLKKELNIEYDFISFDLRMNEVQTKALIARFPLIEDVISAAKELKIDVLSARNDSINLSLKGYESFIRNFDYKGGNGLREKVDMIRLSKDPHSRYWLFQVDSNWIIINDP